MYMKVFMYWAGGGGWGWLPFMKFSREDDDEPIRKSCIIGITSVSFKKAFIIVLLACTCACLFLKFYKDIKDDSFGIPEC